MTLQDQGRAALDDSPGALDITVVRGDSWSKFFQIVDVTYDETGQETSEVPRDLTGAQIRAQVRRTPDDQVAASLTVTPLDLTAGKFYLSLTAATISGQWDLEITEATGRRTTCGGVWRIVKDVTHD